MSTQEEKSRTQLLADFRADVRNHAYLSEISDQHFWTWLSVEKERLSSSLARLKRVDTPQQEG